MNGLPVFRSREELKTHLFGESSSVVPMQVIRRMNRLLTGRSGSKELLAIYKAIENAYLKSTTNTRLQNMKDAFDKVPE